MKPQLTFFEQLIGTTDITAYAVTFTLALIGAFISLRLQAHNRDKNSSSTPYKFSPGFMLMDNLNRLMLTLCLIFVGLRFSSYLLGVEVTEWSAFGLGLGLDKLCTEYENRTYDLEERLQQGRLLLLGK